MNMNPVHLKGGGGAAEEKEGKATEMRLGGPNAPGSLSTGHSSQPRTSQPSLCPHSRLVCPPGPGAVWFPAGQPAGGHGPRHRVPRGGGAVFGVEQGHGPPRAEPTLRLAQSSVPREPADRCHPGGRCPPLPASGCPRKTQTKLRGPSPGPSVPRGRDVTTWELPEPRYLGRRRRAAGR